MKNPFANLFKKTPKGDGGAPVPQAQDTKKKDMVQVARANCLRYKTYPNHQNTF